MTSNRTHVPVNRELITEQMHALGLSERAVIRDTSVTQSQFRTARIDGWLSGTFTLNQLTQLAATLGISPTDLLAEPAAQPSAPTAQSATDDAAHLIPLLIGLGKNVSMTGVRKALGWNNDRLAACLQAVDAALDGTGMRLHYGQQRTIRITPARPNTETTRHALRRLRATNNPITVGEASMLKRLLDGENVQYREMSNATKVHLGALRNMGCLTLNDRAIYEPTPEVLAAFPE